MKQRFEQSAIIIFVIVNFLFAGCTKDKTTSSNTLRKLYDIYKNGDIDECTFNGQTVYGAELNAYDAGAVIYDKDGNVIGNCNYAWGQVDTICKQLQNCTTIYRCHNHISGEPFVDKYGLSQ